ncbi:MAG: M50 family metallopeptidase [Candidatus Daviesbacteria bacterium]|nr:M50 family metallopeptidase [Candidatus Daviesbacteria bacterium]
MVISVIIFIITLLILVVIHEFGHFIMAKRFGIRVEEFGFGIPPRIFGKKIGETVWSLNWLPLGGFVKLTGEDETDKDKLNDSRSFARAHVNKRMIVVVTGVVMNLVLSWVLFYTVIINQNFRIIYPTPDPIVSIARVEEGFPAQGAGILVGDRILSIDGKKMEDIEQAVSVIKEKDGQPLTLQIADLDGNFKREVTVSPQETEDGEKLIGVVFSPIGIKIYQTLPEKIFSGISYSYDLTRITFTGLGRLIGDVASGNVEKASQQVAGPVGLARITDSFISVGAVLPYIWFTGVISLTLAIFNVLPIPALDGGRLFFLIIEAVTRRKVHPEIERIIHTVGFVILIGLSILVAFSDIKKIIP